MITVPRAGMSRSSAWATLALIGLLGVLLGPAASVSADGSWLDNRAPMAWNQAGATVPSAAMPPGPIDPRFLARNRPTESPEDEAVVAAGWLLFTSYQAGWGVKVVQATSAYDAMGRPVQYQAFVFVDGVYAGTLSPDVMIARMDGALDTVSLVASDSILAEFHRYSATDPLCCPSRRTTVSYRIDRTGPAPDVIPSSATTAQVASSAPPPLPSPAPAALPTELDGVTWAWQGTLLNDGTSLTPDDPERYTVRLSRDGKASAKIDCNRASGTFTLPDPAGPRLKIDLPISTRAACPPDSLDTVFYQQLQSADRYLLRENGEELILELPIDSGPMRFRRSASQP